MVRLNYTQVFCGFDNFKYHFYHAILTKGLANSFELIILSLQLKQKSVDTRDINYMRIEERSKGKIEVLVLN